MYAPDLIYTHAGAGAERHLMIDWAASTPSPGAARSRFRSADDCVVGASIGNGFYTRERVEVLLCGLARRFRRLWLVIPDRPALHTYLARGYTRDRAETKLHRDAANLRNRLTGAQAVAERDTTCEFRWLSWADDVQGHPAYRNTLAEVSSLMQTNRMFRADVLEASRGAVGRDGIAMDAVQGASLYILEEFPFFHLVEDLVGAEVILGYHCPSMIMPYCAGEYGNPRPRIPWVVYQVRSDASMAA